MRIGHASISENGNNGRDGKAKAGDQTGKRCAFVLFIKTLEISIKMQGS